MEIARAEIWLSDAITTPAPMAVRKAQEAVGPRARETSSVGQPIGAILLGRKLAP